VIAVSTCSTEGTFDLDVLAPSHNTQ